MEQNMKGAIYLRKSRADVELEELGHGETLSRHRSTLLELAKSKGIIVHSIYSEVVSGESIEARPEMQRLLRNVESGEYDCVLVMEVERLARGDTSDQGIVAKTFKYSNVLIVTPTKVYDPSNQFDEEYFEFGLFMSRREYKAINRRLQAGRLASIKEGQYIGSAAPYGYRKIRLDKPTRYTLAIDEQQAEGVRLIFDLYANGELQPDGSTRRLGFGGIADRLDELGIPTVSGRKWNSATISGIIRNNIYIGKIKWMERASVKRIVDGKTIVERPRKKGEGVTVVDGLHEPIIDMETWNKVQSILNSNIRTAPAPKDMKMVNPLAGLVFCGCCGKSMVRRPYVSGYPDGLICITKGCRTMSSTLNVVESAVLESLKRQLKESTISCSVKDTKKYIKTIELTKAKALQSLEIAKSQRNKIFDLLEQGVYTQDVFLERSAALSIKIAETEAILAESIRNLANANSIAETQLNLIPQIRHVIDVYASTETPQEKNELLKSVIKKVVYEKTTGGRWGESDLIVYLEMRTT